MQTLPMDLRRVMGRFATGVAVVAAHDPATGEPYGLTANAVCSVSLDPPLVLVCVAKDSSSHVTIERAGHFSVNVLSDRQRAVSQAFARSGGYTNKFAGVPYDSGMTGAPLLRDALASLECDLWAAYAGGDHTIFVGRVASAHSRDEAETPLLFYGGRYESLESESSMTVSAR